MDKKVIFLDTETGGLNEFENSLLTVGLALWDNGTIVDSLEVFISKEVYNVTDKAIEVNKIDLDNLRKIGCNEKEAIEKIESFCYKHFKNERVVIAGHNVSFDIAFLKQLYRRNNNYNFYKRFSHRSIDTSAILKYLYFSGKLESDISNSDAAFKFFNIEFEEGKRHSALGDAIATAELFNKLIYVI